MATQKFSSQTLSCNSFWELMDIQIFQIVVIISRVKSREDGATTKVRNNPKAELFLINRAEP